MVHRALSLLAASACLCLPAAGRAQLITNFEGIARPSNGLALFRQPSFSGSTAAFLDTSLNRADVSTEEAFSGTQSLKVSYLFKAAQTNPWLRLTTAATTNAILPNPTLDFTIPLHFMLFVPDTTPDFMVTLGLRETGTSAPIGANGGTNGTIEFDGAASKLTGGAPLGKLITEKGAWQEVVFNIPVEPLVGFTGNGHLDVSKGVLEDLAFTPVSNTAVGPYVFYMDDFRQGPITAAATPEPGALAFLASTGVLGLALLRRRQV